LLQLILDRGERAAWFESTNILLAATGCLIALLYFVAHTALSRSPTFFNYRPLLDANYTACLAFMFLTGLVLFATRALTAPMLQIVLGYSIELSGLIAIPAGIGIMMAMLIAGRFIRRANLAGAMAIGLALVAVSLMQMSYFTTEVVPAQVAWPGFVQGLGLGLVSVSLTTVAFSTLPPALRTDGASTLNLLRNLGGSFGISIMQTLLTRSTFESRAALVSELGERNAITPVVASQGNDAWAADMEAQIEELAAMAGYASDFRLMAIVTLAVMPLLLLLRLRK
jgi:DHA2 family multidrug resistance protein